MSIVNRFALVDTKPKSRYASIGYAGRLADAGTGPSAGRVGDSCDNALAETINGLYRTEVIHRKGSRRNPANAECATLEWVDWFDSRRRLSSIGSIPPAEAEARDHRGVKKTALAA